MKFVNILLENGSVVNTEQIQSNSYCHVLWTFAYCWVIAWFCGRRSKFKDELGQTALHLACNLGHFRIARKLIDSGAHVNIEGPVGRYPIHNACINNYEKILQLLIMNGSKMDVLDDSGQTPLHLACKGGNTSLIEVLLQHKELTRTFQISPGKFRFIMLMKICMNNCFKFNWVRFQRYKPKTLLSCK